MSEISAARLAANRLNAQKSTGPRTPQGKARVAQNATRDQSALHPYGFAPRMMAKLRKLRESMYESFQPANELEKLLIGRIVRTQQELLRLQTAQAAYFRIWANRLRSDISPATRRSLGLQQARHVNVGKINEDLVDPQLPNAVVLALMLDHSYAPLERLQNHIMRVERSLQALLRQLQQLQRQRIKMTAQAIDGNKPSFLAGEPESTLFEENKPIQSQAEPSGLVETSDESARIENATRNAATPPIEQAA